MPSGKSICCHHPSHRFRCVVSAVLQIRWQSIWPRSQGTKPSSHVGRCSLLKAVLIFIIECVCPAQQDTFVMTNVQRFCRLTGFHFTDCILRLQDIWPCARNRWWCLLAAPVFGTNPHPTHAKSVWLHPNPICHAIGDPLAVQSWSRASTDWSRETCLWCCWQWWGMSVPDEQVRNFALSIACLGISTPKLPMQMSQWAFVIWKTGKLVALWRRSEGCFWWCWT